MSQYISREAYIIKFEPIINSYTSLSSWKKSFRWLVVVEASTLEIIEQFFFKRFQRLSAIEEH